jgi:quinoprotein dehydrogenase-associated probable ABC transporter substrate-binding protein
MRRTWTKGAAWCLALAMAAAGPARAQRAELDMPGQLRVCADPHDLPYSNREKQGFENKIASIIASDLGVPLTYYWFPQTVGFVRQTLRKRLCDLIMGVVAGDSGIDTTIPYYHTGYMLVTRKSEHIDADSVADPALASKRFGLVAATPPTDLLLKHHLLGQTTSYPLYVDTRHHNSVRDMLQDLVDGKIDVGLAWGPIVDYAIKHDHLPLKAVFLKGEPDTPRLDYRIAMGVRPNEPLWRRRIDRAIQKHRSEIDAVLAQYGIETIKDENASTP